MPPPKISLTQLHTIYQNKPNINDVSSKKPSNTSFKDRLMLHFPNERKLKKVKLLLEYFKNIIDDNGNIVSPPNINRNFLDVSSVFLNVRTPIHNDEDLDLYRLLINTLNIPKSLIKNKHILKQIEPDTKSSHIGGLLNINNSIRKPKKKNNNILKTWNIY